MTTQIITANVIRRALEFMGAPKPRRFEGWSKPITSERNTSMQQVWLSFDRCKLHQWLQTQPHDEYLQRTLAITAALQECFCGDVQILCAECPEGLAEIRVSCLLIVDNDPVQ